MGKIILLALGALFALVLAACGQPDNNYEIKVPPQGSPTILVTPPDITVEAPNVTVTATVTVVLGCNANPVVCGPGTECLADMCLPAEVVSPPEECDTLPVAAGVPLTGQTYRPGDILYLNLVLLAPCGRLQIARLRPWVEGLPIGLTSARAFTSSSAGQSVAVGAFWDDGVNSFADLAFNPSITVKRGERLTVTVWIETTTDLAPGTYVGGISEYELSGGVVNQGIETIGGRFEWVVVGEEEVPINQPSYLLVTKDINSPLGSLFYDGRSGARLAAFNFRALTNDQIIRQIRLTQLVTDPNLASFLNYSQIYLKDEAGNQLANAIPVHTETLITINPPLVVTATSATGRTVFVEADLNVICVVCPTTRPNLLGFWIASPNDVYASSAATGNSSEVIFGNVWPTGEAHIMYKAVPSFMRIPNFSPLAVTSDLYRYRVNSRGGNIDLIKNTFSIFVFGATINQVELYDITDGYERGRLLYSEAVSIGDGQTQEINARFQSVVTIVENQPRTFVLVANVSGVSSGDWVETRVHGDSSLAGIVGRTGLTGTVDEIESNQENDFIWSDRSAAAHSSATTDWQNGYLVSGLPAQVSTSEVLSL